MKKRLLFPLIALVAVCLGFLCACGGPSVEDMIREDITSQFEEITADDQEMIDGIEESAGDDFDLLNIDPAEFTKSYLDGFDYAIDDINVDEDAGTASATVTVTCKSMGDILNDFQTEFANEVSSVDVTTMSEDDLYALGGEKLMEITQNAEPADTECSFTYQRDDEGEWSMDDSATNELMSAMMA